MLDRAMSILGEAGQVWPLAARWLDILDKFARDNKGSIAGIEGSMADGVRNDPWCEYFEPQTDTLCL